MSTIVKQGCALALFEKIKDESVDLIIADPPYLLGKEFSGDQQSGKDFKAFTRKWLRQAFRVLKPSGTIYVFMGVRYISYSKRRDFSTIPGSC